MRDRLPWPRAVRWFLKMDRYGDLPTWWQWLIPRYGNWGGPGWSAGRWNGDPVATDWSVAAKTAMDQLFKDHDRPYQNNGDVDEADKTLVLALRQVSVQGVHDRGYRIGAILAFTMWPHIRHFYKGSTMKRTVFLLLAIVAVGVIALPFVRLFAGDVPAITPADFDSPAAHWLWSLLASDGLRNIVLWGLSTGIATVLGWLKWNDTRKEDAIMFLTMGVRETYEEYVRRIQHSRADGKLTDEERRQACHLAIQHGVDYGKTRGLDILKVLAKESLPTLVDSIVRKIKGEAALAKLPLQPQLPDLQPLVGSAH